MRLLFGVGIPMAGGSLMHRNILYAGAALFVIACCLPVLAMGPVSASAPLTVTGTQSGAQVLASGWLGLFLGNIAWFANPLWLLGGILLLSGRRTPARVLFVLAVLLSLHTFAMVGTVVPQDEGGVNKQVVVRLLPGAYVWLAALAVSLVASLRWPATDKPPALPTAAGPPALPH